MAEFLVQMMKPLIETIAHLTALFPVLSSWESCALSLIEKHRPTTVSFVCKTANQCPKNSFYQIILHTPSQTFLELQTHELPEFKDTDLVFLPIHEDDIEWNNETVHKYLRGGKNYFKIVVVASMRNDSEKDIEFMTRLFGDMWKSGVVNTAVLLKNDSTALMFTYIPYKSRDSCEDTSPVMIGDCKVVADTVFDDTYKINNLNKCPLRASFAEDKPWFQYEPFIGRLKPVLEELGHRMNFTVETISPSEGVNGGICGAEEFTGTKGDVVSGRAHFAMGTFNRRECSTLEYINIPYTTCLSWCTPIISAKDYIYTFLFGIFQPKAWLALSGTVVVVVLSILFVSHWTNDRVLVNDIIYLILVVFATVPLNYRSSPVRLMLGLWLLTCLVIRTAYEGEMKSQSAVPLGSQVIRDLEGIVDRVRKNTFKKLCTTRGNLQVLKTIDEPNTQYLYSKASTCSDGMYTNIVAAVLKQDRVIFTSDQRCKVTAAEAGERGPSMLYPFTGGCTKLIQIVPVLTLPGCPFRRTFRRIQFRSFESGLFYKWMDEKTERGIKEQTDVLAFPLRNLLPALFIYFLGCVSGFTVLLVEVFFCSRSDLKIKIRNLLRRRSCRQPRECELR